MDPSLIFAQSMSGLSRGMMLFLIASGLSLIFGVMNILNFAHATFWLIGAYLCYTFWYLMQDFGFAIWISIPLAALTLAAFGWVIEVVLIRRVYHRDLPEQLLLTYAMVLVLGDLIKIIWGVDDKLIERPPLVAGPVVPLNRITSESSTVVPLGPPVSPGTVTVGASKEIRIEPSARTWKALRSVPPRPTSEPSK